MCNQHTKFRCNSSNGFWYLKGTNANDDGRQFVKTLSPKASLTRRKNKTNEPLAFISAQFTCRPNTVTFLFQVLIFSLQTLGAPSAAEKPPEILPVQPKNRTLEQIMTDQTEAVRKIIEAQRQSEIDYPVVTKKETDIKQVTEKAKDSIDEIHAQCQQLLKQQQQKTTTTTTEKQQAEAKPKPLGPFVRPDLNRRKFNGLVNDNVDNVKLIKFEPVILQKTVLKDGQVVYYWHKSLPFPQYFMVNPEEATTSTSTTTTTTPRPTSTTGSYQEQIYGQQLRFVLPVPYPAEGAYKHSSNYDPYAYYSRYVHPQHAVPVELPVPPTLPIIKTLIVPNKYAGGGEKPEGRLL